MFRNGGIKKVFSTYLTTKSYKKFESGSLHFRTLLIKQTLVQGFYESVEFTNILKFDISARVWLYNESSSSLKYLVNSAQII